MAEANKKPLSTAGAAALGHKPKNNIVDELVGASAYEVGQRSSEADPSSRLVGSQVGSTVGSQLGAANPVSGYASMGNISAAPSVIRHKRHLQQNRLQLQGALHNHWDVTVEQGTILSDILETDFWKHIASKLRPHDELSVITEDGKWFAKLIVVNSDVVWAKVYLLSYHNLEEAAANMPQTQEEDYEISWTSFKKYAVIKKSNRGQPPLKDGFQTKLEALTWLDGHLKTINS